jgi:hypothetical protein
MKFEATLMKKQYCIASIILSLLTITCVPFPDRYERIEPGKIRTNGFTYEPYAEGAPGDTIRVAMHFAGEKVDSVHLLMSYSNIITVYGTDTVMDIFDLPVVSESNRLPDSLAFSFVVPESTFFLTKSLSQEKLDMIKKTLPSTMQSLTQQDFAAILLDLGKVDFNDNSSMAQFIQRWGSVIAGNSQNVSIDSLFVTIGELVGIFSIPAVIYAEAIADNGKRLKIKGDFSIRYNRRLLGTPFASFFPVNDPPKIRWIGLYKVKSNDVASFFPADPAFAGKFSMQYLYNELFPDSVRDTVVIDNGYTYYLAADSGMVQYTLKAGTKIVDSLHGNDTAWRVLQKDSTIADTSRYKHHVTAANGKDTTEMETFYYDWQYEARDLNSVTMPLDSLMVLSPTGESVVRMLPSLDTKFTHSRIWTTVFDKLPNEFNRPTAFAFRLTDIYFTYTERYKKAVGQ